MIRRLLSLADNRAATNRYLGLIGLSALVRAATVVALVPLLARLFGDDPTDGVAWLGGLAVLVALGWLIDHRLYRAGFDIGFSILRSVETRVLDRLERIPLSWLNQRRRADGQRALTSAGQEICQGIGYLVTPTVNAMVTPLLIGVGLLGVAWQLGAAAIVFVPLLLAAMAASGRLLRRSDESYARASDDVGARIVELAQHQAALRAAGRSDAHGSALGTALARQRRAALRLLGFSIPGNILFGLVSQLALVALAGLSVWLHLAGDLSAAELVALLIVTVRFLEPFTTLGDLAPAVSALRNTVERVDSILTAPELAVVSSTDTAEAPTVEFDAVAFGYPGASDPTVSDISFQVAAGTTTAIVGPSGSGKTTLLGLAARLHDVDSGTIRLCGRDVRGYELTELADLYSIVHQDVYLFDGTLRDNILMGRRDATDAELAAAAEDAGLGETLRRLPNGWQTRVGESGATLSGGERQRVAIARALLKGAPLLLLDEATSALDLSNERGIVAALAANAADRATVIVAHRLDTIIGADHIVFLDNGRIVESGPPQRLLAADGRFARHWRQRREAGRWQLVSTGSPQDRTPGQEALDHST
ncbi:ATP-binding cassette subfamily B protein IrtB [Stackebrandtia endophytica]|uniref:ATP-binding cassette subfamily B protein IrtB n=1 Tax=Stackebrandtia endophytica TaxID=1496996 RepID=A0A543ARC3_9ACTN|nr:ABC transporter ATP-binding protein [Stackebrandtia endophytica]TQL75075.1 ATP-binding cassette subfamily B protein IrtB [Stackebrandtia endophytica]